MLQFILADAIVSAFIPSFPIVWSYIRRVFSLLNITTNLATFLAPSSFIAFSDTFKFTNLPQCVKESHNNYIPLGPSLFPHI